MATKRPRDPTGGIIPKFFRPSLRPAPANHSEMSTSSETSNPRDEIGEAARHIDLANASFQNYSGQHDGPVKKAEEKYDVIVENASNLGDFADPLLSRALRDVMNTEPVKKIGATISAVIDNIPALLGFLDQVAKIHPFIEVAVGAFRFAVGLDLERRRNDKKVSELFAKMKDMIVVLLQLQHINADERGGDDNITITERMKDLIQKTANDIKNCADACKEYAEKSFPTKLVCGLFWRDNLEQYINRFMDSREEFVLALSLHTGQAVNVANSKLTTIHKDMARFHMDSSVRQRQLAREVQEAVHHEGNHIITEVTFGPCNKIIDPTVCMIWKQMGWGDRVEGWPFVVALREHFQRELHKQQGSTTVELWLRDQDSWVLEFIIPSRALAIAEAFADEASPSRYIYVGEVNTFTMSTTSSRPKQWSLLHWLAYWAIGRQMYMSYYAEEINILLGKMFALRCDILPANRNGVDRYLHDIWTKTTMLTAPFESVSVNKELLNRFKDYTQDYQKDLIEHLKNARYTIDGEGTTLPSVCGSGPIEKHVFPLLYFLLKRDFEIMLLAREECLHARELEDSRRTILLVFDEVDERCKHLAECFKQEDLKTSRRFKNFAFGMFKYTYKNARDEVSKHPIRTVPYDKTTWAQDVDPASILKYPLQMTEKVFMPDHGFEETEADKCADPVVQKIVGRWAGFCGEVKLYPSDSMISLDIHGSPASENRFQSTGLASNGTNWSLTGKHALTDSHGVHTFEFTITYADHRDPQHFSANLDEGGTMLTGSGHGPKPFTFMFKRLSSEVMRFYPTPAELAENKSKALWRFAIYAIRDQVSRKQGSWWWLKARWDVGQRYAKLIMRRARLTAEEVDELARCQRAMTPEEARLFNIFIDLSKRSVPIHWDVECKACSEKPIQGNRILCISCDSELEGLVNLCDKKQCLNAAIRQDVDLTRRLTHDSSHDLLKLRTAIHPIEYGEIYHKARLAMRIFAEWPSQESSVAKCVNCDRTPSLPCWYCIECKGDDIFVCLSCDVKHSGITTRKHKDTHALIQCRSYKGPEPKPAVGDHVRAGSLGERLEVTSHEGDEQHQHVDSIFLHPVKAARAFGTKLIALVQECVHA